MPIETVSLLATLFFLPGAEALGPMEVGFDLSGIVVDESIGEGPALMETGTATFHYEIVDGNGKVLASSERRGLPFTSSPTGTGSDMPLLSAMVGVRAGGRRRLWTDADALGIAGEFFIPSGTPLEVRVRVLAVGAAQNPMVDSRQW
ncbi:MAG: FKBP-type peptidyl-prolyl cis-trans isomerase [Fimbriimonas sp.]